MVRGDANQHLKEPYQAILKCYRYWTCQRAQKLKAINDAYKAHLEQDLEGLEKIFSMENELHNTDSEYICVIIKYRRYMWT